MPMPMPIFSKLETDNCSLATIRFRRFRRFSPQPVVENGKIGKNSPSDIAAFAANSAISPTGLFPGRAVGTRRAVSTTEETMRVRDFPFNFRLLTFNRLPTANTNNQ
jgi:hypothetical protein